jgi:hypothetical protein
MGTSLADLVNDLEQHLRGGHVVLGVAEATGGLHSTDSIDGSVDAANRPSPLWRRRANAPGRPGRQIRPVGPVY